MRPTGLVGAFPPALGERCSASRSAEESSRWRVSAAQAVAARNAKRWRSAPANGGFSCKTASSKARLAPAKSLVWPKIPGLPAPPQGERLVPKIDVDGNETSRLRLPAQALPIASFTGWNAAKEKAPGPCTAGAAIPFPPSRAARSLLERYGARSYFAAALRSVADKLVKERLLLPQDADAYVAAGKQSPF